MKLSRLLQAVGLECPEETEITDLTCDSRCVKEGILYAALEGVYADGRKFVASAVEQGAAAILCRGEVEAPVPVISVPEPRETLGLLAAEFFDRPAERLTVIAVTGTKGKTTTAHMLREILMAWGCKTGMIGTLGAFVDLERISSTGNTTPEPIALHRLLRQMADRECTHVVMEASSQAVKLHRLSGLTFDVGVFLNLSPDHIGPGEHENFEEYRLCKAEVLERCRCVVGNGGDSHWPFMAAHIPEGVPRYIFENTSCHPRQGLGIKLELPGREPYQIPLPGTFNGQNAMAALVTAELLGASDHAIREGLSRTRVPGRCMVYPAPAPYGVVIDYAHNGVSFRALFAALREQRPNRIIAVFGAGGDRPPMRRWDLGRAAAEGSDFAVLTEDNPRSESAEEICAQIARAMPDLPYVIIPNRREAIRYALDLAQPGDVVALLGKGHEECIEANGVKRHFSEWEVLDEYFGR